MLLFKSIYFLSIDKEAMTFSTHHHNHREGSKKRFKNQKWKRKKNRRKKGGQFKGEEHVGTVVATKWWLATKAWAVCGSDDS